MDQDNNGKASISRRDVLAGLFAVIGAPAVSSPAFASWSSDAEERFQKSGQFGAPVIPSARLTRASDTVFGKRLNLLMDVSESVDEEEYKIQQKGLANALRSETVRQAIRSQGGIALSICQFSSSAKISLPWVILETDEDIDECAALVETMRRVVPDNQTDIGMGLNLVRAYFDQCPYEGFHDVIDLSGDGGQTRTRGARADVADAQLRKIADACGAKGITVNCLAMPSHEKRFKDSGETLTDYFHRVTRTPHDTFVHEVTTRSGKIYEQPTPGGFVLNAYHVQDFEPIMRKKLSNEIAMPAPRYLKTATAAMAA